MFFFIFGTFYAIFCFFCTFWKRNYSAFSYFKHPLPNWTSMQLLLPSSALMTVESAVLEVYSQTSSSNANACKWLCIKTCGAEDFVLLWSRELRSTLRYFDDRNTGPISHTCTQIPVRRKGNQKNLNQKRVFRRWMDQSLFPRNYFLIILKFLQNFLEIIKKIHENRPWNGLFLVHTTQNILMLFV